MIFHCARPTRGVFDRALREHRRSSGSIPSLLPCAFCEQKEHLAARILSKLSDFSPQVGSLVDPRLRASNEHILIVRVPRAGGRPGYQPNPHRCPFFFSSASASLGPQVPAV